MLHSIDKRDAANWKLIAARHVISASRSHPYFIEVIQQIGGVLVDPIGSCALEFISPVAA